MSGYVDKCRSSLPVDSVFNVFILLHRSGKQLVKDFRHGILNDLRPFSGYAAFVATRSSVCANVMSFPLTACPFPAMNESEIETRLLS